MGLLDGKKAVIFGVANDRSIAWAIAEAFHAEGAELAFTYAGEVLEKRVRPLADGIGSKIILPCDVTKDQEIESVFATLNQEWGGLDILIHAIAFANKEDLSNPYVQTSRAGFHLAMDVSAYSMVALARYAAPLMEGRNGAMVTLTYMGSEKVDPQLQRDGHREGSTGSERSLPGLRSWTEGYSSERDFRRADPNAGRGGNLGLQVHVALRRRQGAAEA